jgi:GAF domain-containing protein
MEGDIVGTGERSGGSQTLGQERLVVEALQHVADLAVGAIESVNHASIMLMQGPELCSMAASDAVARDLDRIQLVSTDGPCFVALRRGDVTRIMSMPNEDRWLSCREACLGHNVMSVASVPIHAGEANVGALNLYSQDHHGFGAQEIRLARSLAVQAATIVRAVDATSAANQLSEDLAKEISARAVIEQAKGIIIATTRCSADQALDVLVRQANHEYRPLEDVARALVASKVARARKNVPASVQATPVSPAEVEPSLHHSGGHHGD